jgi:putrescine carbamoyltransferase
VINGLTGSSHPTQALCDVFTMIEHAAPGKPLEALRVTFVGNATNVCNSLAVLCTQMGMHFTQAAPGRYQIKEAVRAVADANCAASGGSLTLTEDVANAVRDADYLYTDLWWWMGQGDEIPDRHEAFIPRYQLNASLLARAPAHCRVMHCLPAARGIEATSEVLDSPRSIIFDQAGNRLHIEKALLTWLVYPRLKQPGERVQAFHRSRVETFLHESMPC